VYVHVARFLFEARRELPSLFISLPPLPPPALRIPTPPTGVYVIRERGPGYVESDRISSNKINAVTTVFNRTGGGEEEEGRG